MKNKTKKTIKRYFMGESFPAKIWRTFRHHIPRFVRNIFKYKKELWEFRPWNYSYNIMMLKRSLELTCDHIEHRGIEVDESRMKKVAKMKRAIEIMQYECDSSFIELAEKELGIEVDIRKAMEFKPIEEKPELYEMIDNSPEIVKARNSKVFKRSSELEEELWKELWTIIQGQGQYTGEKTLESMEKWDDGSNLRAWWD